MTRSHSLFSLYSDPVTRIVRRSSFPVPDDFFLIFFFGWAKPKTKKIPFGGTQLKMTQIDRSIDESMNRRIERFFTGGEKRKPKKKKETDRKNFLVIAPMERRPRRFVSNSTNE